MSIGEYIDWLLGEFVDMDVGCYHWLSRTVMILLFLLLSLLYFFGANLFWISVSYIYIWIAHICIFYSQIYIPNMSVFNQRNVPYDIAYKDAHIKIYSRKANFKGESWFLSCDEVRQPFKKTVKRLSLGGIATSIIAAIVSMFCAF